MMAPKTRSFHLLCLSFTSVLPVAAIFLQIFILGVSVSLLFRRVEEVVRYPGLPPRRQLTYQAKQTISREMEQEKMRRAEQLMLQRNPVAVRCPACSAVRQCCVCSSSNVSRRVCVCCRNRKRKRALVPNPPPGTISRGWRTLSNRPQWRHG